MFAGYGGLGMGVQSVLGGEMAWCAEFDKAPSKILAHHWPDVPNLGDVTKVDWATAPKVDVITGGSPCQDLSHAGKRAGMKAGTRSGLWASMCDAIDIIRPRLVVWENVRGALSAEATSAVEPCPLCVGDDPGTTLRALGRVLGDLSELGYDARWYGLRAADVGAAHGRFRVFIFATPASYARRIAREVSTGRGLAAESAPASHGDPGRAGVKLLPSPRTSDTNGPGFHGTGGQDLRTEVSLLPTPKAADWMGGSNSPGHQSMLSGTVREVASGAQDWREYEAAIRRQEQVFGRPAPLPTEPGKNGQPRLAPAFVEWLMGLPAGHVTDPAIGLSRNDQLKALGNGVVPQQAAAATRAFLSDIGKDGVA